METLKNFLTVLMILIPNFMFAQTQGSTNGHDWIDLGLSVKWATTNIGASSPSDYGHFIAWGEIEPKSTYNYRNSTTFNKHQYEIA